MGDKHIRLLFFLCLYKEAVVMKALSLPVNSLAGVIPFYGYRHGKRKAKIRTILLTVLLVSSVSSFAYTSNNDGMGEAKPGRTVRSVPAAIAPGTRVQASHDIGCGVTAGTQGTYWGANQGIPPAYVIWDLGGGCADAIPSAAPFNTNSIEHRNHAYWVYWDDIDLVPQDDHGDTCSDASSVLPGVHSGRLAEDDQDYFQIQVPYSGTLTVFTTGDTDTFGILKDSECSGIAAHDDVDDNFNFYISQPVSAAGTYYVGVQGYRPDRTGAYTLNVHFTPDSIIDMMGDPTGRQGAPFLAQEYIYYRQEIQMYQLTTFVAMLLPSYACDSGDCQAQIVTDPDTGATMGGYPSGNTLMFSQNGVYYSLVREFIYFSTITDTVGGFCACVPGTMEMNRYMEQRQVYSYQQVVQMSSSAVVSNSSFLGARSAKAERTAPNPRLVTDEPTKAMLKQALKAFDELVENRAWNQ
ncbi:MAG: hypothetical protein GY862_36240 [Gammaproteobacteria bacterium]|nr:hypothetical protein [Gammaproteobacteria bacterium]